MAGATAGGPKWLSTNSSRELSTPSPTSRMLGERPRSAVLTSPSNPPNSQGHGRNHSFSPLGNPSVAIQPPMRKRSNSTRGSHQSSSTFAPTFIQNEALQRDGEKVRGIEGENDFSGRRYVWLRDPVHAFTKGSVEKELDGGRVLVLCDDGSVRAF